MSRRPRPARSRLSSFLALGLLGLLAAPARAADDFPDRWHALAVQGEVHKLDALLSAAQLAAVGETEEDFLRCVSSIEEYGAPMSRTHPEVFGALLDRLHARALELGAAPDSPADYRTALAITTATRCRHQSLNGLAKAQPAWRAAAERIAAMHETLEARSGATLRAAAWLCEAALQPGEKYAELLARAKEVIDAVAARKPDEERLQAARDAWYVARARAGRIKKAKAYGKAAVVSGLAYIQAQSQAAALPPGLATLRAHLVAENRAGRFGVRVDMQVQTRELDGLVFAIPTSAEWAFAERAHEGDTDLALQRMRGAVPRRKFGFTSWDRSDKIYVDRDRTSMTSVTNPKTLAEAMFGSFPQFAGIADVTERIKPQRVKLHKDFTDAWRIGVEGYTGEKRWMRAYSTYFRSKKSKRTYNLIVFEYQNETEVDPVADFVVMSMRRKK